jgi:hypothetical protein
VSYGITRAVLPHVVEVVAALRIDQLTVVAATRDFVGTIYEQRLRINQRPGTQVHPGPRTR